MNKYLLILMLIASPSLHADNWLKSRVIQEIVEAAESQIDEQIQSNDEDETVEQHEPAIADSSIEEQKVEADAVTPAPSDHSTSTSSDWDAIVAEERRKQAEQDARDEAEWKRQQEKRRQEYDEMRQRTAEDKARKEAERKRRADEQRRKDAEMFARSREQERLEKEQRQREEEEADRRAEEEVRRLYEEEQREREQRSKAMQLEIEAFYRDRRKLAGEDVLDLMKAMAPDMSENKLIRTYCSGELRVEDYPILYRDRKLLEDQGADIKNVLGNMCVMHGY